MPKTTKDEKNNMVLLTLDRIREVRFGHKALKMLMTLTGKSLTNISEEEFSLDELEKVMFCGLYSDAKEHGEDLKLEDMEDLLDHAKSFNSIMDAMEQALNNAFQQTEKN
jgi:hypothetical protein